MGKVTLLVRGEWREIGDWVILQEIKEERRLKGRERANRHTWAKGYRAGALMQEGLSEVPTKPSSLRRVWDREEGPGLRP